MREVLLSDLEYITPKMAQTLKKNNIVTVEDLLFSFPTKFDDYTIVSFDEAIPNTNVTVGGVVQNKATVANVKTKLSVMNFFVDIDGNKVRCTIFNRHFLKSKINYGVYVRLTGKFNDQKKNFTASEISFNEFSNNINPVFNIKGISDEKILLLKERVFEDFEDDIVETLPKELLQKMNLIPLRRAIKYINIPDSNEDISKAIKRIKYEELLVYELKIKYMLFMRKNYPQGVSIKYDKEKVLAFINQLPFTLTSDQKRSVDEILYDLEAPYKMNRLLQGEVGSGKTVVAAISLYAVITAGYQGAIMVPTEVLANQHFITFKSFFDKVGIRVELLTSSVPLKDRQIILDDLKNKKIDILIGTHALFQKDVEFSKLGLVITDEEHRFGVRQRVSIVGKGYLIDHLKMSATPIPRTLAISILGESDISMIKTLPSNRKNAITKYLQYSDRREAIEHIRQEVSNGHQAYIIVPMIEESEAIDLINATEVYERMVKYYEGFCKVGLIHGRLKKEEKDQVMKDFNENKIQILVSTSVIEVGVNVINATIMVILNADRFGIAQLHQMRGRVRRSEYQPYCYLISDATNTSTIERLKLVEENSDGFALAEEDLIIRGPGDFFGEKQSGMVPFKMANLVSDKDILEEVNVIASEIIVSQKLLNDENYKSLYKLVDDNYNNNKEMLD